MSLIWHTSSATERVPVAWDAAEIERHNAAWARAKADFENDYGRPPATAAEFSAIARRAEAILEGKVA